jgi:hypothetical protein
VLKFVTNGGKRLDPPLSRERCKSVIQKECNDPTSMTYHQQDVDTNLVESYKLEKMERIERMQDVTQVQLFICISCYGVVKVDMVHY